MKLRISLALSLLFLPILWGCSLFRHSNLSDRPPALQQVSLPREHSLNINYPPEEYLHVIAVGNGSSFQKAKVEARNSGLDSYARMISTKVSSLYLQEKTIRESQDRKVIEKNIQDVLNLSTRNILVEGMQEVYSWNGYEGDKIYFFARYVLNKEKAGRLLKIRGQKTLAEVEALQSRLQSNEISQEERERLALDAMRRIFELEIIEEQARFFNQNLSFDFASLKLSCTTIVYKAGKRRASGKGATNMEELHTFLREAYQFYNQASRFRPEDTILIERLKTLKKKMSCQNCSTKIGETSSHSQTLRELAQRIRKEIRPDPHSLANQCLQGLNLSRQLKGSIQCSNCNFFKFCRQKGFLYPLSPIERLCGRRALEVGREWESQSKEKDLKNALALYQRLNQYLSWGDISSSILRVKRQLPCPECKRSGVCGTCRGSRGSWTPCYRCGGDGKRQVRCRKCSGTGKSICSRCRGKGKLSRDCPSCRRGRVKCRTCRGLGRLVQICSTCRGQPYRICPRGPCMYCRFTGRLVCNICRGTGKLSSRCRACFGRGNRTCRPCRGQGRLGYTCPQCNGGGRSGICSLCRGHKELLIRCRRCRGQGKVWHSCSHCRGSGKCPTCKGKGHHP